MAKNVFQYLIHNRKTGECLNGATTPNAKDILIDFEGNILRKDGNDLITIGRIGNDFYFQLIYDKSFNNCSVAYFDNLSENDERSIATETTVEKNS